MKPMPWGAGWLPKSGVANTLQTADMEPEMIGFVALGIVMLIWVLTWDSSETTELTGSQPPRPESRV